MSDNITLTQEVEMYDSGIESDNENETAVDPFDPEEISIESKLVSMDNCLRRLIQGTIFLSPDFQRNEVWTIDKKSQLMESMMLKIPLPMFYVSADEKNNFTVVDGLQRLSTIRSFILGEEFLRSKDEKRKGEGFRLQSLEFWKVYEGKNFNELPVNIKNRILETEFRFTVINPGTPEEVRRNIFKRLNTGGMPLSSQEIRNALYIGKSTILLKELAGYKEFTDATGKSIKSLRMEDKELILRFLAFLVRDYSTYKKTVNVDSFLSDTMLIINAMPHFNTREFIKSALRGNINKADILFSDIEELGIIFRNAMIRSFKLFKQHTFRKSYGNFGRKPINKSLFETWGVLISRLSEREFAKLLENKKDFLHEYISIIENPNFQIAISRDSMKHTAVKYRFELISDLIKKHSI